MELKLTSEIDLLSFCVATKQKQVYNLQTSIVDQCDFINMYTSTKWSRNMQLNLRSSIFQFFITCVLKQFVFFNYMI